MTDWPARYTDEYGDEHDWDDTVSDEDVGEPMTYRELAHDLAAAQGVDLEDFLDRQRLGSGALGSMSPPWVDDASGYGC